MTARRALVAVFVAVLTIGAAPAGAQSADAEKGAAAKKEGTAAKKEGPRKVIQVEELKVEGRIQKPQAMFLMPRANLSYGDLDRSEPFVPKVKSAVQKSPF
jgi:poly-gamma-glutamate capsule biosynthesis protein CapA/YwtB (metallophosphatase superfamily)